MNWFQARGMFNTALKKPKDKAILILSKRGSKVDYYRLTIIRGSAMFYYTESRTPKSLSFNVQSLTKNDNDVKREVNFFSEGTNIFGLREL